MVFRKVFPIAFFALSMASSINAATFIVTGNWDDSNAHDANPGDGICNDIAGFCSLRAAIEEANAFAGEDTIEFKNNLPQLNITLVATEGPLPVITEQVRILGTSLASYNSSATLLRDAPPKVFIIGSNISGALSHGLAFSGLASSMSKVSAIGIVGFPGDGINIDGGARTISIDRSYIGVLADGSPIGNGGNGIHAIRTIEIEIGKRYDFNTQGFISLGNVISSNAGSGVYLEESNGILVYGNLIGISPSGSSDRGNGQFGVRISGISNTVGMFSLGNTAGNFIAGNNSGGVDIIGVDNWVYSNTLGAGETGSFINSEGNGVSITGTSNRVGTNTSSFSRNYIYQHAGAAVSLGVFGGATANENFVENNQIGSAGAQFPLLYSSNGDGIYIRNGDSNMIQDNIIINSGGDSSSGFGVYVDGDNNSLLGNQVGFVNSNAGPVAEPNKKGMAISGNNNTIGSISHPNLIGGNTSYGIYTDGGGNIVAGNYVGVTALNQAIGNAWHGIFGFSNSNLSVRDNIIGFNGTGIFLDELSNSPLIISNWIGIAPNGSNIGNLSHGIALTRSTNSDVAANRIAFNAGDGISVPSGHLSGVAWFQNLMHDNGGIGIDLGDNGVTPNDPGDVDEGQNRLQNFPVIESASLDTVSVPPKLTIGYRVDSEPGRATYPMFIDFYWSDQDEPAQGRYFLATDFSYTTQNALRMVTFNFVDGVPGGWLTATALEQGRNTSELAARFKFGNPVDLIFADSLE